MDQPRVELLSPAGATIAAQQTAEDHRRGELPVKQSDVAEIDRANQGNRCGCQVFDAVNLVDILQPGEAQEGQHDKAETGTEVAAVDRHWYQSEADDE